MAIHSQSRTSSLRQSQAWQGVVAGLGTILKIMFPRSLASRIGRSVVASGLVGASLVVAVNTSASASGFGSDAFMNIDGSMRFIPSPTAPANQYGWANSGLVAPDAGCSGSPAGAVDVPGTNGLYNCGAPNPAVANGVPVPPKYIGPSSVLAQAFLTTPDGNVVPGCGSGAGTYDFPGSQVFNEPLSSMSYGFVTNVPQKDALSDAYVVSRLNSAGQVEVFFGAQRTANNGDSHVDFQFLQDTVAASGTCSGSVSGSREQGDMLVEVNYQIGSSSAVPNVYMWVCNGGSSPTGTKCDTTGNWIQQAVPSTPVLAAIEASNNVPIPCGGWVCLNTVATPGGPVVPTNEFVEGAINLGKFGFGVGCGSSVFVETRTSGQSGTSQLASLAKPASFATCAPTTTTTTPSAKTIQFGQSLTDSVTVTSTNATLGTPKGQVTFYICSNTTTGCSAATGTKLTGATPNPVTLDSLGKGVSPSFTPPAPGNYCFAGVYTPTQGSFFSPSSDGSTGECFVVTGLTPGFTTQPATGSITFGGSITDTASVIGSAAGGVPGGSVTFFLCSVPSGSSTCSGGNQIGSAVQLTPPNSGFTATAQSGSVSPAPGNYCFNASYTAATGGNYQSVSAETNGANECFTVNKQGSKTATTASGTATFGGGTISDHVDVTPTSGTGPAPTGTVQFYVCETTATFCPTSSGTPDGSPVHLTVPLTGSTSSADAPAFPPTSPGTWCFSAVYSGDGNYLGSADNTTADNAAASECVAVGKAPSKTTTVVFDNTTGHPWSGTETVGASAYDTASVAPFPAFNNAPTPTGTISYQFFNGNGCSGNGSAAGSGIDLTGHSTPTAPLAAGSYSYQATYSGDSNYQGSVGACENFNVAKGTSAVATTVFDAATNHAWTGAETTGASAYDTSSVSGSSPAFAPSGGTVSYVFFTNETCSGTGTSAGDLLALNSNSNTEGPLAAGGYAFEASYSGDANYLPSTGSCEDFDVNQGTSSVSTVVFDAATNAAWTGSETTGASAYDTSSVSGSSQAFAPSGGTVSYHFFTNESCSNGGTLAGDELALGSNSSTEGPLGAGGYSFQASYSGDANYLPSTGPCETFDVNQGTSSVSTVVFDAATNAPWTGSETGTPSAYDTSSVTASSTSIAPTGTVSYTFFPNGNCAADTGSAAGSGLSLGTHSSTEGPLSQGVYSFQATYSGDANYTGSTGDCETFSVLFPVVTASKSSSPADGSVVHPGDVVTYTITLSNAGLSDATGVALSDVVPAGTTYKAGSASDSGVLNGSTVHWTGLTVPAGGTKAVTFQVTVNAADTDGQVIPNHAIFPNINTPQSSCTQSSDTTTQVTAASVQTPSTLCDTNTVTLTVSIPIINVVKSEPTPGDGQTVTAGQSAPITYKLAVTNAGSDAATNVVVTDVIPAGSTYVAGSATPAVEASYNSSTKTITWTIPSVPAKSGSTPGEVDLTFQVTVDSADANGSTITNQAAFTNLNTPNCTAGSSTAVCLTNTVSNPVVVPPPVQTQPAPQVAPTTTVPKHALAFTGMNVRTLAIVALALVTFGTMFVLIGRRRRPNN